MRKKLLTRFARTKFGKSVLAKTGRALSDKEWVFVLGCYNSGTTLLQKLMQLHPDIAAMSAEGVVLTDVIVRPEEYGWTRMWWKCAEQLRRDSDYSESGAKRVKAQWSWLLNKPNARYALEKSIVNTVHVPFYRDYFNRTKFIHLVRNGYAVSEGIRRKANLARWNNKEYKDHYPISLCARQWVETLDLIESYKQQGVEVLEIKYEDLTADPDAVLGNIFEFLQLPKLSTTVKSKQLRVHGITSEVKDMNQVSIDKLSSEDKKVISNEAAEWLEKYHYK